MAGGTGGCVGCAGLVGGAGPYLPGDHVRLGPFRAVGGAYGYVQGRELGPREPRLPRFIQLGSFSDTFLVVSILVCDCHL